MTAQMVAETAPTQGRGREAEPSDRHQPQAVLVNWCMKTIGREITSLFPRRDSNQAQKHNLKERKRKILTGAEDTEIRQATRTWVLGHPLVLIGRDGRAKSARCQKIKISLIEGRQLVPVADARLGMMWRRLVAAGTGS